MGPIPWRGQNLFCGPISGGRPEISLQQVNALPRKLPETYRKFPGDFPWISLTVELNSNPEVPRKFHRLPWKFPGLPRKFPRLPQRSAPFSGKPDSLCWLSKTLSDLWDLWPHRRVHWCRAISSKSVKINSVQTRCIVKGEAQKSPLLWRFSGGFSFSQDRLFSRSATRRPLNWIKSLIFTNTPCKPTCLYNAPSMHTVEKIIFDTFSPFCHVRKLSKLFFTVSDNFWCFLHMRKLSKFVLTLFDDFRLAPFRRPLLWFVSDRRCFESCSMAFFSARSLSASAWQRWALAAVLRAVSTPLSTEASCFLVASSSTIWRCTAFRNQETLNRLPSDTKLLQTYH